MPRTARIVSITPQWIFPCCSGAASIFTNNLYFHIALLPGPSLQLAASSCKQGGWYKQGLKLGAAGLRRGPSFLTASELRPLCLLALQLSEGLLCCGSSFGSCCNCTCRYINSNSSARALNAAYFCFEISSWGGSTGF